LNTLLFTPDGAWTISDVKAAQAPRVLAILRETAAWLQSRGLDLGQDFAGGGEDIALRSQVEGSAFLVERGGQDAACVVLQWQDPFWGEAGKDGQAGWIHSLAVRRVFTGKALGKHLLLFMENLARARRKDYCRLDVLDTNARLKAYFRNLDYRELGTELINGKTMRLMEKNLR
jgi:ribosomal protein S18 acetylase RimI-like enzyme